jgi:hypothetical protein
MLPGGWWASSSRQGGHTERGHEKACSNDFAIGRWVIALAVNAHHLNSSVFLGVCSCVFLGEISVGVEISVSSGRLHFSPDPSIVPDPSGSVTGSLPNVVPVYRAFGFVASEMGRRLKSLLDRSLVDQRGLQRTPARKDHVWCPSDDRIACA